MAAGSPLLVVVVCADAHPATNEAGPKALSVSKKLTHKVALKKHRVVVEGRVLHQTLLELVIWAMIRSAASRRPFDGGLTRGNWRKLPAAGRRKTGRSSGGPRGVVSRGMDRLGRRTQRGRTRYPSENVDHKYEEFCKAVKGIPTPLGEAILASHRRWSHRS